MKTARPIILNVAVIAVGVVAASLSAHAAELNGPLAQKLAGIKFNQFAQAPGYSEGPTWRDGAVYFCSGALLRASGDGAAHPYLDLGPAGTVLRGDGHLLVCDNKYKAIVDVSPDGAVNVIVDQFEGQPLRSLNDLTIDVRGNVYWTDPEGSTPANPVGSVFRVLPSGKVERVATGLAFPNGLDVDPASEFLYVIESQSKKILRYALKEDRLLGKAELFYDLGGSGGDGCAFDAQGNLWVADFHRPETGFGRITVLNPKAEVLAYLPVPAKVVSNIAFGGPNRDEIFCTTGDPPGVFHAKVGVPGFAGHPGKPLPIIRSLNLAVRRTHPDAQALRDIVAIASKSEIIEGRINDASRREMEAAITKLTDDQVRKHTEKLLPELDAAAARSVHDRKLLSEVARLSGKATQEVMAPSWLRSIVGDDALGIFNRIVELRLNERTDGHKDPEPKPLSDRVNDETLKLLADETDLRRLELSGTAVTSGGLVHLRGLTNLQFLNVCLTAVSDDGFENLSGMTKMRRMTVCSSRITGTGFEHLTGMKQLESINLHSSPASDAGLAKIGAITSLKRLEIVHTDVSDVGLKSLRSLVNLQQLHVHGRGATDAGLPFLGELTELYEVDLYDRVASNQTLEQIGRLPKLRMLRLLEGSFDNDGLKALSKLESLEELVLSSSKITDSGLDYLPALTSLKVVKITGPQISKAGQQRLKSRLSSVE